MTVHVRNGDPLPNESTDSPPNTVPKPSIPTQSTTFPPIPPLILAQSSSSSAPLPHPHHHDHHPSPSSSNINPLSSHTSSRSTNAVLATVITLNGLDDLTDATHPPSGAPPLSPPPTPPPCMCVCVSALSTRTGYGDEARLRPRGDTPVLLALALALPLTVA